MKKHNFYFIGECMIVLVLLILIAVLVKDRGPQNIKSDSFATIVEEAQETRTFSVKEGFIEANSIEENVLDTNDSEETISDNDVVEQEIKEPEKLTDNEEDKVKIVVFGDSIWADGRGTDGISEQVMEQLDVEIYNCAIGGTTAAVKGESTEWDEWQSRSFNGMMYIANDIISADELIPEDAACEVIKTVDFEEIDYVVVSYGLNDYFSDITIYPKEYYDLSSYVGALRHGIHKMREEYPHLQFIVTSPTYTGWFAGERQFELGEYVEAAREVATQMDVFFLDMYHAFGKNAEEKIIYLEDGVHLTKDGRRLYARSVIDCLKELEKEEN